MKAFLCPVSPVSESGITCDTDESEHIEFKSPSTSSDKRPYHINEFSLKKQKNFPNSSFFYSEIDLKPFEIIFDKSNRKRMNPKLKKMVLEIEEDDEHN